MLSFYIAQIKTIPGDVAGNLSRMINLWKEYDGKVDILVFPAYSISGFFPGDYLLKRDFIYRINAAINELKELSTRMKSYIIFGTPYAVEDRLFDAAIVIGNGDLIAVSCSKNVVGKMVCLSNSSRYFYPGDGPVVFSVGSTRVIIAKTEDLSLISEENGVETIVALDSTPYFYGSYSRLESYVSEIAGRLKSYIVNVRMVGGYDEFVFDGRTIVANPLGKVVVRLAAFEESGLVVPLSGNFKYVEENLEDAAELYKAVSLSLHDFFNFNHFDGVILGLSGGIDSSLVTTIAVDTLGSDKVRVLFMPTEFTSDLSREDSYRLAANLGVRIDEVSISNIVSVYRTLMGNIFGYEGFTVADENIQARARANLLFYISNRENLLVLATSNKSETAVGYATLYGDMTGGFAPIKDVYKTWVYKLARYRNSVGEVIPERVILRAPSAELKPGQTDQDVLPPYSILDKILELYIEENLTEEEIVEMGYHRDTVKIVIDMVRKSEYKRRQGPPGPKLTKRSFDVDWHMPITFEIRY